MKTLIGSSNKPTIFVGTNKIISELISKIIVAEKITYGWVSTSIMNEPMTSPFCMNPIRQRKHVK